MDDKNIIAFMIVLTSWIVAALHKKAGWEFLCILAVVFMWIDYRWI